MKTINTIIYVSLILIIFFGCDSNEDNDPTTSCDTNFYTIASSHWDWATAVFDVVKYQKSDVLSTPSILSSNNNFNAVSGILSLVQSAINPNTGKIVYLFPYHPDLYQLDINANAISVSTVPNGGLNPEYVNNNLFFLKTNNTTSSSGYLLSGDCTIIDTSANDVSQIYTSIDFSNSGVYDRQFFSSTSNNQDTFYYLANTKLIIYNKLTDTWNDYLLETYNETTNKVMLKGLEYVDDNTLYALRSDLTDSNNITLELIKIDLTSGTPQISVIKDLTSSLSVTASDIFLGGNANFINSSYDACDDNYYFTTSDASNFNSIIFEIKNITNVINEYPANGKILYGLDKD